MCSRAIFKMPAKANGRKTAAETPKYLRDFSPTSVSKMTDEEKTWYKEDPWALIYSRSSNDDLNGPTRAARSPSYTGPASAELIEAAPLPCLLRLSIIKAAFKQD